jgi:hypothetical protein
MVSIPRLRVMLSWPRYALLPLRLNIGRTESLWAANETCTRYFHFARWHSWELASILGAIAFVTFMVISVWSYMVLKQPFNPLEFGTGAGGLAAGTGAHKLMSGRADN